MSHLKKLSLFAAAMLMACGGTTPADSSDPQTAQSQNELIGGIPDTGDPAIVALYVIKPGASSGALCTATFISPTVVVTAAHCVHPSTVGTGNDFFVLTSPDITDKTHPSPRLTVKETHYDPMFDRLQIFNGHDIAVAILESPTTITPLPWNSEAMDASMTGKPARLVGYGLNDSFGMKGAGIKRQITVKLNNFDMLFVKTGSLFPWRTICSGDSGGPVLMKIGGVETVVGVNSFGIIGCLSEGSSTRLDIYKSFIKTYVP